MEQKIECVNGIYGNPGAGKSTLLNCLIKQRIFESGLSAGGLTRKLQQFYSEGRLWIDTPGLADPLKRTEAAAEIETGLKKTQNYKIAFVVTTDAGRVRVQDIETINCVCDAIKTEFSFGLIINKLTPSTQAFLERDQNLDLSISLMHKRPSAVIMIPKVSVAEDENNVLITDNHVCQQLVSFFDRLRLSFIRESEVAKIDTRNFDERVADLTLEFQKKLEIEEQKRKQAEAEKAEAEHKRQQAEAARAEEVRKRKQAEAQKFEAEQQRKQAEAARAEQERKREAERIVSVLPEHKIEYSSEIEIGTRTETHSCRKLFNPSKTWYFTVYGRTATPYVRNKISRGSGAIEFSDWVAGTSVTEKTREVHTRTTVP